MAAEDLRRRRLEVLEEHFRSEVDHDWDRCLATFEAVPRLRDRGHRPGE